MELFMSVFVIAIIAASILLLVAATFLVVKAEEAVHKPEYRDPLPTQRDIPYPSNDQRYALDEMEDVA